MHKARQPGQRVIDVTLNLKVCKRPSLDLDLDDRRHLRRWDIDRLATIADVLASTTSPEPADERAA